MDTVPEWREALVAGLFWLCATTFLLVIFKPSITHVRSYLSIRNTLVWFSAALWFGIVDTFRWRAFRFPVVLFTVVTFAVAVFGVRRVGGGAPFKP